MKLVSLFFVFLFSGCCPSSKSSTIAGIYDWKVICESKQTCYIDSPSYVNLLFNRDEPIKIDVTRREHLDYIGRKFDQGIVHRNYMNDCRIEITENDYFEKQFKTIDLVFTKNSLREIKMSITASLDKLIERISSLSKNKDTNKLALLLNKAIDQAVSGTAQYRITVVRLNSSAISRFINKCGRDNGIVEITVVQIDSASIKSNIVKNFLASARTEIGIEIAEAELSGIIKEYFGESTNTSFDKHSFLAAAGWARHRK